MGQTELANLLELCDGAALGTHWRFPVSACFAFHHNIGNHLVSCGPLF